MTFLQKKKKKTHQKQYAIILTRIQNRNMMTHSWAQVFWFVYWLHCSPLCAVCRLKKAAWTHSLKKWERWEVLMKSKNYNLDMTPCDGKIWMILLCYSLTHTIWSFCSSFRACLLPGSSFNTSWKSKTHPETHVLWTQAINRLKCDI